MKSALRSQPLPPSLFEALCGRDLEDVQGWVADADPREVGHVATVLIEHPWCALGLRRRLIGTILAGAPTVPGSLMRFLSGDLEMIAAAASNSCLSPEQEEFTVRRFTGGLVNPRWSPPRIEAVARLLDARATCSPPLVDRAAAMLQPVSTVAGCTQGPNGAERRVWRAIAIVATVPGSQPGHLARAAACDGIPPHLLRAIFEHPNCTRDVWMTALRNARRQVRNDALRLLQSHEAAVHDHEVRECMLRSNQPHLLATLLRHPQGDAEEVLEALQALDHERAISVLVEAWSELVDFIPLDSLKPLLMSEDPDVRAEAFRLIGRRQPVQQAPRPSWPDVGYSG